MFCYFKAMPYASFGKVSLVTNKHWLGWLSQFFIIIVENDTSSTPKILNKTKQ